MVFSADTLRDFIENAWSLTGRLSKTATDNQKEIVIFYAYPQIVGNETSKAVTVQKINALENELVVQHPNFNEVSDIFEIELRYRTTDVQKVSRDESFSDLEDMGDEVVRILKLQFSPGNNTGIYFRVRREWQRLDDYLTTTQPDLRRRLRFTLTTLTSDSPEVYTGFGGVLVYDKDQGTGNQPSQDYEYTEVDNVRQKGGTKVAKLLTRARRNIPQRFSTQYTGEYTFETKAKQSDINSGSTNFLNQLGAMLSNNEHPEVFLIQSVNNGSGNTLNQSTRMVITDFEQLYDVEELVAFKLTGDVFQPPVFTKT